MDEADLCWVLTDAAAPYHIVAASERWYATWRRTPEETLGKTPALLHGKGSDKIAGRILMEQFSERGVATQRCINVRSDGKLVKHTVSLLRTQHGLLAISSDMDTAEAASFRQHDGHAPLMDVAARIASDMHAQRERAGAPPVTAADIVAAALDELEDSIDDYEALKLELAKEMVAAQATPEAWADNDTPASAPSTTPAVDEAATTLAEMTIAAAGASKEAATAHQRGKGPGSGSYDSTMATFEAELAAADHPDH